MTDELELGTNGLPDGISEFPDHENGDHRILSIQSHVVSGYAGNRSAVFPLQVLGFDVDFINTVQYSNHTAYPYYTGSNLDEKSLGELYDGLTQNKITRKYTHILTGYIRSKALLEKIVDIVKDLRKTNPEIIYVCDPVMGDFGKMYVPEDMLQVYRDQVLPLANVITPNQFEIELLTGIVIKSQESAVNALNALHKLSVPNVIITSSDLGDSKLLIGFGSCLKNGDVLRFRMAIPKFPASFTGTGDLFTALLLAWMIKTDHDMQRSCEYAISTLQAVLRRTMDYRSSRGDCTDLSLCAQNIELRLIQSKRDIENPRLCIRCETL